VRKKEADLTAVERLAEIYGAAWGWIAFAPVWRLLPAFVVGKRIQENANLLIERWAAVPCGFMRFFTSDQLPHSPQALLQG
jgi:hypothetical protein